MLTGRLRIPIAVVLAILPAGCASERATTSASPIPSHTPSLTAPPSAAPVPPTVTASPTASPSPDPTPTYVTFGPGPVEIPILLYHHITPGGDGPRYTVSAEAFEEQLTFLATNGYHTVTVADVAAAVRRGTALPPRPIVLTFDDGNLDTFTEAWPRMQPHGFVGVVYVVANRVGAEGFVSARQLTELAGAGWEIGSHSFTHASLLDVGRSEWRHEIIGSKLELERLLGIDIESFAYPFGVGETEVFRKTAEYGYDSAVGLGTGRVHDRGSLYYLDRREVLGNWDLAAFVSIVLGDDP